LMKDAIIIFIHESRSWFVDLHVCETVGLRF